MKKNKLLSKILLYLFLTLFGFLMVFPFLWMVATSLKYSHDVFSLSLLPTEVTFDNYRQLLEMGKFPSWFFNSLFVGIGVTCSAVFFDSLVGYTICKFDFPFKKVIFIMILATVMIPTEMLVIPWYIMANRFGWIDSYWGIMFPGMMTGFGTFLMKQFYESVPDDLLDAARIDGMSEFKIWLFIAQPLVKPALAALAILVFLGNWNTYLWPLIVTTDVSLYTIPVGLAYFSGEYQTQWELVMAGASIATIPVIIVFMIFQKQIIKGIQLTGLKN
ncbi:MAG: carbohydrate ABC transporter permease [Halanaerobiales bacterium]